MRRLFLDVTNAVDSSFISGIQRVVREFGAALAQEEGLVYLKRITGSSKYSAWTGEDFLSFYKGGKAPLETRIEISLDALQKEDIFLDFDSVWNNFEERRHHIYRRLKKGNVLIVTMVYDVLPVLFPHFFREDTLIHYLIYLSAVLSYTDVILVNSEATRKALNRITDDIGCPRKEIHVIPLGANFSSPAVYDMQNQISTNLRKAVEKPFLMMLGTIEPRKNHAFVLDAYDKGLKDLPVNLVFAGREGWNVSETMDRIRTHPDLNERIFFIEKPTDEEVDYLYKKTWGIIFASAGEGFGLPVLEALNHGKFVFASDIEVLREIGGECCFYFNPGDELSLIEQVANVIADPALEREKEKAILNYHVMTWEEAGTILKDKLKTIQNQKESSGVRNCSEVNILPRQIYMISARVEDLLETLPFYENFLPFLEEVVVGCPAKIAEEIRREYQGRFKLTFVTDEVLLKGNKLPDDHQARNLLLRALTIKHGPLDDVFIMADDDNRPLRRIGIDFFIKDGKFVLYYCYPDMKLWRGAICRPTSYDLGIGNTYRFLLNADLPTKQYSSHAPQVICRRIYCELLDLYPEIWGNAFDEWSIYGNYASAHYGDFFINKPYCTMNWPGYTSNWKVLLPPKEYVFENFYREMYEEGAIFEKFSQKWNERIPEENMQKIQIRMQQQEKYAAGEKAADLCDKLYASIYHHNPVWMADLDRGVITIPKVLIGPKGHLRKVPFIISNTTGHETLVIEGSFTEKDTARVFPFQNEYLELSGLEREQLLNIHYPDWNGSGNLQLTFTVDGNETVRTVVSVMTY